MEEQSIQYRVQKCSKCSEDCEYVCVSCQCDLCPHCKENHVHDLKTMDHNVVIYQEKFNHNPEQVIYLRDPNSILECFVKLVISLYVTIAQSKTTQTIRGKNGI